MDGVYRAEIGVGLSKLSNRENPTGTLSSDPPCFSQILAVWWSVAEMRNVTDMTYGLKVLLRVKDLTFCNSGV